MDGAFAFVRRRPEEVGGVAQRKPEQVRISRDLFTAVKLSPTKSYVIAQRAGIDPVTLSRILHGAQRLRPGDPRVLAVAREVGVPAARAFE